MSDLNDFFQTVIDSLQDHVAVIDKTGTILFANREWRAFADDNGGSETIGANYLEVCRKAANGGDLTAILVMDGIARVIAGRETVFHHEYPCHGGGELRWFTMTVTRVWHGGVEAFVVSHRDITQRVLAERQARELSLSDALTGLANRRRFDEMLDNEWARAIRGAGAISLVLIDVDHFKRYNDTYGHPQGDECLRRIGGLLASHARRPGDVAARYGGEEFALLLPGVRPRHARMLAQRVVKAVSAEAIAHADSPTASVVTISAGAASLLPVRGAESAGLMRAADSALYRAKRGGRNRVVGPDTATRVTTVPPVSHTRNVSGEVEVAQVAPLPRAVNGEWIN